MTLELRLFGGLELADAAGLPIEVSAKKARALVAYLAAQPGRRHAREQVAALLWGDVSADEHARRSLRQALSVLRKGLPPGVLESGRDELGLAEAGVRADVREFHVALERGDRESLRRAVALYRGELLEGFSARADGFDEWVGRARTRLRELAIGAMERLGRLERDAGQVDVAVTLAMRVVAIEPLRESAHRDLMQLYVAANAPGRALKQYDTCHKLLARELGIAPSPATTALAARIRTGGAGAVAAPVPLDAPPRPQAPPEVIAGPTLRQVVVVHVVTAWDDSKRRHEAREETRRLLTRFGGRVLRDTADAIAAVYGAGHTRGRALEQAVRAALALRDRLSAMDLVVRIGVAAGQALVEERPDGLLVQGDVVSLAGCLHEVGSVVISGAARAELGERAEVRERSPVRGAAAWELLTLGAEGTVRSVLFGRDFELAQLSASLAPCVATGRGRSFVVRGEPGIGKTLLVACFCKEAKKAGFAVRRQHVLDFGRGTETELLHALARTLLVESTGAEHDVDVALEAAVARGDLATSDLGFARQMIDVGAAVEIDAGPEETAKRHGEIVAKLLCAHGGRRPQLVWIEDIHWAPLATLRQLTRLMASVAAWRVLLVMTTRIVGEPDDADWRRAVRGQAVSTLDLAPLDEAAAHRLMEWLQKRRGVSVGHVARVIARAAGNPLFLEQLSWADTADAVPSSVQALVQSRMDALDASSRFVLEAASALGQELEEAALVSLMGSSELDLSEPIEHGLLRVGTQGVAFAHALVRDAVYASLTDERRRALHVAAAAHYADRNALLRAGHLERARDEAAPSAYGQAADEHRRRGGMEHALELCDRGLALATRDADLWRLGLLRGDVLRELGRTSEALAAFDAARRYGGTVEEQVKTWLGTASVHRLLDDQAQALEALDEARRVLADEAMPELSSHVHFMRGNVLFPSGDADACLAEHQRALELGRQACSPLAEAQALNGMADAHYVAGRMRSATRLFERCEALAQREGLGHLERTSRGMRLVIQVLFLGVREGAERCLEEADRAERVGALRAVAFLRTGACLALGYLGDWERMAREAQSIAELTRRMGARRFEALARAYLGVSRFHLGREHGAELARAAELSMASGMAFSGGIVHAAMVSSATDPSDVRRELRAGLAALDAGAVAHGRILFLTHAVLATIRLRDPHETRRLTDMLTRTTEEPCELVALFVDLGRAAAAVLDAPDDAALRARLVGVGDRGREAGLEPIVQLAAAIAGGQSAAASLAAAAGRA